MGKGIQKGGNCGNSKGEGDEGGHKDRSQKFMQEHRPEFNDRHEQ
jgi:hypothetical protein